MNNIEDDSDDSNLLNSTNKDSEPTNKNETGPIRFSVDFDKLKNNKKSSETIYDNESFDYFCKNFF